MMEPAPNGPVLNKELFSQRLGDLLKKQTARHISGAQLAPLIAEALGSENTYRDFLPKDEPPRLRVFVDRFVSPNLVLPTDLRKGSDYLFDIVGSTEPATAALSQQGRLWRSFVSIDPRAKLVLQLPTVSVKLLDNGIETPADCVEIQPVTLDEHADLCRAFAAELRSDGKLVPGLEEVLAGFDQTAYPRWLRVLRSVSPLDRQWGAFRQRGLLSLFADRLRQAGVQDDRVPGLQAELELDHDAARLRTRLPPSDTIAPSIARTGDDREKRARDLLRLVADKLPLDQLQTIQLPLGAILDLLGTPA